MEDGGDNHKSEAESKQGSENDNVIPEFYEVARLHHKIKASVVVVISK